VIGNQRPIGPRSTLVRRVTALLGAAAIVAAVAALVVFVTRPGGSNVVPGTTPTIQGSVQTVSPSSPISTRRSVPHVMVIMEENRGYAATLGSCSADPYFCSLAAGFVSATSWYGISHPSAPNYLAIDSGSIQGITSDCTPDGGGCGPFASPDLGTQLSGAGIPWVAYMEGMASACDRVGGSGGYAEKHDPFMYFLGNRGSACATHVLPYPGAAAVVTTLDSAAPPDFVWITPNLANDMHDGSVARGDAWLRSNVSAVLSSAWFAVDGTVIITMDENDAAPSGSCCGNASGGQVPMVVISAKARGRGAITVPGDQYVTLRSIEEVFGLNLLQNAAHSGDGDLRTLFG
jgi:phosphatidylinositol-3-phosphatase